MSAAGPGLLHASSWGSRHDFRPSKPLRHHGRSDRLYAYDRTGAEACTQQETGAKELSKVNACCEVNDCHVVACGVQVM